MSMIPNSARPAEVYDQLLANGERGAAIRFLDTHEEVRLEARAGWDTNAESFLTAALSGTPWRWVERKGGPSPHVFEREHELQPIRYPGFEPPRQLVMQSMLYEMREIR